MSKENIIINEDAGLAYLKGVKAVVSLGKEPFEEPPIAPVVNVNTPNSYAPWGSDNAFPDDVISDAYKSTIIPPVLEWKARALYSGGLVYGTVTTDEKSGEEILTPKQDAEIDAWLKRTAIKKALMKMCSDYYWFYNIFPAFILSKDRSQIAVLAPQDASYCRWSLQNPNNNNQIEKLYVNANWSSRGTIQDSLQIPVLDIDYDGVEKLRKRKDGHIYVYPVSYPTPGRSYYQVAAWETLRKSGWLGVAQNIPLFKKKLMENQLSIKYHIEVSMDWWKWKYPDWDKLTAKEKKDLREKELENFNSLMQGATNAGKSIMSTSFRDRHTGTEYAGWKITAIDDKIKDGVYVEDSQEASSHHYSALGVDPTLIGTAPGKGMGAGSGSDKRVAFNIYVNNCRADQDLILEPLQFIAEYNGWTERIKGLTFWFRNYWISTLESGAETQNKNQGAGQNTNTNNPDTNGAN